MFMFLISVNFSESLNYLLDHRGIFSFIDFVPMLCF